MKGTFRSLAGFNYRIWAGGAIVSNIGTWMQRVAQDWLVLTQLTHHNATAMGVVMGLQFGPQLLFLPLTGYAADRLDKRKLLIVTQASMGLLAFALAQTADLITGMVLLWDVYFFAFVLVSVSAFDAPARLTFVAQMVDVADVSNGVALNSTSFNIARDDRSCHRRRADRRRGLRPGCSSSMRSPVRRRARLAGPAACQRN